MFLFAAKCDSTHFYNTRVGFGQLLVGRRIWDLFCLWKEEQQKRMRRRAASLAGMICKKGCKLSWDDLFHKF
eukprot:1909542-Amphidinium_carterae.1